MIPADDAAPAARRPYVLMVVEDDADLRHLLRILIALDDRLALGSSFDNARDALAAVGNGCRPDAILCDVGLPGMSGLEALPRLRDACPDTVIVMYTGNPEGSLDALARGADAVVSKDTLPARLFDHVVALLERTT
jgi:CheY-like chemotaxis protein